MPDLSPETTKSRTESQIKNINALNITISSQFLTNLNNVKKMFTDNIQDLKMLNLYNRTGLKIMVRPETNHRMKKVVPVPHEGEVFEIGSGSQDEQVGFKDLINTHWIVEFGTSSGGYVQDFHATNTLKSNTKGREGQTETEGFTDMASRMSIHKEDFVSLYRPLRDINVNQTDEKCYIISDYKTENLATEKKALMETDNFVLIEVASSKTPGVKNIYFNSLIQIKSELNFDVKLHLDSESIDSIPIDLHSNKTTYIPIRYCTSDISMTVLHSYQKNLEEETDNKNKIEFATFLDENQAQQFTNIKDYYMNEDTGSWSKIISQDTMLTISSRELNLSHQKKEAVKIVATFYKKKIYISNRGSQKESYYAFLITLRPIFSVKNLTPTNISLILFEGSIEKYKGKGKLLKPNDSFFYQEDTNDQLKTGFKVPLCFI